MEAPIEQEPNTVDVVKISDRALTKYLLNFQKLRPILEKFNYHVTVTLNGLLYCFFVIVYLFYIKEKCNNGLI